MAAGHPRDDGRTLDLGTLDALGGVVAIAIERAHFLAGRKTAETLSQRADLDHRSLTATRAGCRRAVDKRFQ